MLNRLDGKICVVTGASAGIGKATTLGLARLGAHVVLVVRDRARGQAVIDGLVQAGIKPDQLELMICDVSSQKSIRQFAEEYKHKHDRLHVLVNNAGVVIMERKETVDGLETTFATNHLGYFLLTELLLDTIKASTPARIVNVSSGAHAGNHLDFDDLQSKRDYAGFAVYGRSKLANLYFTYELSERLAGSGVTVNALHPGVVSTQFGSNNSGLFKFGLMLARPFFMSEEKGARTSLYLAASPDVEGVTGKYFAKCKEAKSSGSSHDEAARKRLWDVSESLVAASA